MTTRRDLLAASLLAGVAPFTPLAPFALAAPDDAKRGGRSGSTLDKLNLFIPANPGGGWDQTGRSLGAAMQSGGLVNEVLYENKGGKGGLVGLPEFLEKYSTTPNALIIGGLVMVGALAMAHQLETLKRLTPIARLTSDYMVVAVRQNSPYKTLKQLTEALVKAPGSVHFVGGSAGGVDHMLAGMILRTLKADVGALKYSPTAGGKDALQKVERGEADVVISGYSEVRPGIEDKQVRALGVSSRRSLFGIPSMREQGLDTELANWRGVFAPAGLTPAAKEALRHLVVRATETAQWKQALLDNSWIGSLLYGKELEQFLEFEEATAAVVTSMLKLK